MVHILGVKLDDRKLVRVALQAFYGVGEHTANRICARMSIHNAQRVKQLTQNQITALASFLSSPHTSPPIPRYPLASLDFVPPATNAEAPSARDMASPPVNTNDPLLRLRIEADLKRQMRENILHQRTIGSYVGRRHAAGLPVRGQNTHKNAKTAKKLNRVDRRW